MIAALGELLPPGAGRGLGPQPEHVRQGQAGAERADLEEVPPIEPVAETLTGARRFNMVSPLVQSVLWETRLERWCRLLSRRRQVAGGIPFEVSDPSGSGR